MNYPTSQADKHPAPTRAANKRALMYPLVPDQEQEPDQKKIPGIPPQRNDSSRVAAQGDLTGDGFVPARIQVPGRFGKWRYEIARQVVSLDLVAPFRPAAEEGGLIAHDDPGVRATHEATAI